MGCHGQCDLYAAYKAESDRRRDARNEETARKGLIIDSVVRKRKAQHEVIKER